MAHVATVTTYSLAEAALKLGVTRVTLWRHVRDGKLAAYKRGRGYIVSSDDLLDYVLTQQGGRGIPEA